MWNKEDWEQGAVTCSEWCRAMQDIALDNNDEATAMAYYSMAELWIKRGL